MREILFRGKRKDNGEWVEGSYLYCLLPNTDWTGQPKGKPEEVRYIVDKNNINYAVIPETVGQCTGLTDKNGKKIFEGDIHEHEGDFFVVEYGKFRRFDNSDFAYGWHFRATKNGVCEEFYGDEEDYVNITGNIHDNPELLEVHNG